MMHAPGETNGQTVIWIPEQKVMFCGDNFYYAFPNLYTIRGTSARDPKQWSSSLDTMMTFDIEHLVGSHTQPIEGVDFIRKELLLYRDLIDTNTITITIEGPRRQMKKITNGDLE